MCGIAGFIALNQNAVSQNCEALLKDMTDSMPHRGPDADGFWSAHPVYIGHRRLSILDLTPQGAQPMQSKNGRFIITFNGEIYNHADLARVLTSRGIKFSGHSDTEVLLEAFAEWGVLETLDKIKGMFAIALWDNKEKILHLIRDHVGKKPLYAGYFEDKLVFASELKAIKALSKGRPALNREALTLYTRYGFVPAPYSIYQGIYKLKPGHRMSLSLESLVNGPRMTLPDKMEAYWRAPNSQESYDAVEGKDRLKALLTDAVASRMIADVPIGGFLSGGTDSSLVVAIMQSMASRPVQTFSIGFEENAFDETPHAHRVAQYLGTDHYSYQVTADETRNIIPLLPDIYDEPFADYSQIPTYHICRIAKTQATVALSGDGGDELFCGYSRYFYTQSLYRMMGFFPQAARTMLSKTLLAFPESLLTQISNGISTLIPPVQSYELTGKRLHSIARFAEASDLPALIQRVMSLNQRPQSLLKGGYETGAADFARLFFHPSLHPLDVMMRADLSFYLPDDILVKLDRASMANSLEVRSPLLDKDVVDFALRIPAKNKVSGDGVRGKKPLYNLLLDYVPENLINRPKQGFSVPMAAWLRGSLRPWAEELLSISNLETTELFEPHAVNRLWRDFISEKTDNHAGLWTILMAQAWHDRWNRA